jgi:RNA polymerase sigma-70 factor (ECF subfamily)
MKGGVSMTNRELQLCLAALKDGDSEAFESIYHDLGVPLFTIIRRIVRDKSHSEDVLQELFIKLYQSPPQSVRNPRAYIFQMARNLAIDSLRALPQTADLTDCEDLPDPFCDDELQYLDIESALAALPPLECQIVSMHVNASLKFREIAEVLGMPIGTAIWRYHQAIKRLRNHLSGGLK